MANSQGEKFLVGYYIKNKNKVFRLNLAQRPYLLEELPHLLPRELEIIFKWYFIFFKLL